VAMPKIRKTAEQRVTFQVVGWKSRRIKLENKSATHNETFIPIKHAPPDPPGADLSAEEAPTDSTRDDFTNVNSLPHGSAARVVIPKLPGWRTKRKISCAEPVVPVESQQPEPLEGRTSSFEWNIDLDDDSGTSAKVQGQGVLALLPDGSLSGAARVPPSPWPIDC
jgi:hypothetical protein